jgi:hypothetical protein
MLTTKTHLQLLKEGLVGEAAQSNQQNCLNNLPNNYSYLSSSLGELLILMS